VTIGVAVYLWIACYAPRWVVRRIPFSWRRAQLARFLETECEGGSRSRQRRK
jgi:hypothetical protein